MDRDTLLIPLLVIGLILGIYIGTVLILSNLAHAYTSQAGTATSLIPAQVSMGAAMITSVGTLLLGLVAGLLLFPGRQSVKQPIA